MWKVYGELSKPDRDLGPAKPELLIVCPSVEKERWSLGSIVGWQPWLRSDRQGKPAAEAGVWELESKHFLSSCLHPESKKPWEEHEMSCSGYDVSTHTPCKGMLQRLPHLSASLQVTFTRDFRCS